MLQIDQRIPVLEMDGDVKNRHQLQPALTFPELSLRLSTLTCINSDAVPAPTHGYFEKT